MIKTILIIIAYMTTFSIAMLPIPMVVFYKRLKLDKHYDYQSMLRVLPLAVVLIIVSAFKVIYIAVFNGTASSAFNINVSLFFSIALLVCILLSIYFVIDRATFHLKPKSKKLVLNVSAGAAILLAIFAIFRLVIQSQENQTNYLDLAINFMFPMLTSILSFSGVISLIFYKKISKEQRFYSFIFALSIPLLIIDLIFSANGHYMLTCIPYLVYIIKIYIEVFSHAEEKAYLQQSKDAEFKNKYDLTDREMEVYNLASQGMSNHEISQKLFVSIHTVKTHLQHIFSKLDINHRYQLINFEKDIEEE